MTAGLSRAALQTFKDRWVETLRSFPWWQRELAAEVDALLTAPSSPDAYVDWGSGELLAMTALDDYPVEDGLLKSTSVVYRIHQLGRARAQAEARLQALAGYVQHKPLCRVHVCRVCAHTDGVHAAGWTTEAGAQPICKQFTSSDCTCKLAELLTPAPPGEPEKRI